MSLGQDFTKLAKLYVLELVMQSEWYRTAPGKYKTQGPKIVLKGVEDRRVHLSEGVISLGWEMRPHLIAEVTVGTITADISVSLEVGRLGLVVETERAALNLSPRIRGLFSRSSNEDQ